MKIQKRLGSMTRSPSGSKHLNSRLGILTGSLPVTITQAVKSRGVQLFVPTSSMEVMGSHSRGASQEEAEHGACLPPAGEQAASRPLCPVLSSHIVSKKHHSFLGFIASSGSSEALTHSAIYPFPTVGSLPHRWFLY